MPQRNVHKLRAEPQERPSQRGEKDGFSLTGGERVEKLYFEHSYIWEFVEEV